MNETTYVVTIRALGKFPVLLIDKVQFLRLKQAKVILDNVLAIEEKYEILIANFIELEREALNIALTQSLRGGQGYEELFEYRVSINTRMVNLLTSSRLYIDHLTSNVTKILESESRALDLIDRLKAEEFEKNEHYRFFEALRNYVQHAGLAIHHLILGTGWITDEDQKLMEFRIQVGADKALLSQDKKFKKKVLVELPDRVDLLHAARAYVESLSAIHLEVRKSISQLVDEARKDIQETIDRYAELWDEQIVGLAACEMDGAKIGDFTQLLLDWDNVRLALQDKNRGLVNLRKRFVTSKISPIKQPAKATF